MSPTQKEQQAIALIHTMVAALVDKPDQVRVLTDKTPAGFHFYVYCAPEETGKLIGKAGRNARALRTILMSAGMKLRSRFEIDIHDPEKPNPEKPQ